jgi:hypothetical protein
MNIVLEIREITETTAFTEMRNKIQRKQRAID